AEAVAAYRAGELPAIIEDDEKAITVDAREEYTQEEPLLGEVASYLEMGVPADWDVLSGADRRMWYTVDRFMTDGPARQQATCSMAIFR
ncbi:hypothetical protein, partial [Staphylococcus aureus]